MTAVPKVQAAEGYALSEFSQKRLVSVPRDLFEPHISNAPAFQVLDLFAGAGGFSLGFEAAGAVIKAAVELDAWACETLTLNHQKTKVIQADLSQLDDDAIRALGPCDIIIGGPPCQGYSIANNNAGDPLDPRNSLFKEFVRAAAILRPRAVLLENVPGLLKRHLKSKEPVIDVIVRELTSLGYHVAYQILEAQSFGVPQIRPRLFVAGYLRKPQRFFPPPTHGRPIDQSVDLFGEASKLLPYVSVWEAISDLPDINAREGAETMRYSSDPQNEYQVLARAGSPEVYNNVAMRHSSRLVERFSHVKWGESGMDVPEEYRSRQRGDYSVLSGKAFSQNNRRMHPDRPCHTVPASFYANFIHPFKHRNFTPREGARIQSFPDWYRFCGKPTVVSTKLLSREQRSDELHLCQYNQIGNAVPPLMAFHLASNIFRNLESEQGGLDD